MKTELEGFNFIERLSDGKTKLILYIKISL